MKKNLIRFGSVAALAAGMAFAQAQAPAAPAAPNAQTTPAKPGAAHRQFRQHMRQRMMDQLNLTPVQRDRAKIIFQQARQNAQPFAQQLRQNRQAMTLAVKADDAARIRQLAMERGRLTGQVMAIRSEAAAKFYANLTPAQRAKADQIHQRFEQRWQQHMGPRTNGTGTNG
ncbi:MAG TPA: Spy/CpxP family protein refolding chaperone [Bryobacteraceae bacterium]|nr:Spy/CpxP family protein refolding chaperone [Bryobacteraceae bacterium]